MKVVFKYFFLHFSQKPIFLNIQEGNDYDVTGNKAGFKSCLFWIEWFLFA